MHLITARPHPPCWFWVENRLHHSIQSSSHASKCKHTTAGQTAHFQTPAELGYSSPETSGSCWADDQARRCTSKGLMKGSSFSPTRSPTAPRPLSSRQCKTLLPVPGPAWPSCSSFWAPESQSFTCQSGGQGQVGSGSLKDNSYPPGF